jgi:hypothetical protein
MIVVLPPAVMPLADRNLPHRRRADRDRASFGRRISLDNSSSTASVENAAENRVENVEKRWPAANESKMHKQLFAATTSLHFPLMERFTVLAFGRF